MTKLKKILIGLGILMISAYCVKAIPFQLFLIKNAIAFGSTKPSIAKVSLSNYVAQMNSNKMPPEIKTLYYFLAKERAALELFQAQQNIDGDSPQFGKIYGENLSVITHATQISLQKHLEDDLKIALLYIYVESLDVNYSDCVLKNIQNSENFVLINLNSVSGSNFNSKIRNLYRLLLKTYKIYHTEDTLCAKSVADIPWSELSREH